MAIWGGYYFFDSVTPTAEEMIFFYDYCFSILFMIFLILMFSLKELIFNKNVNLNLQEEQNLEMSWTCLPIILLLMMAGPSLRLLYFEEESFSCFMTLKVVGHQWYWSYEYPEFKKSMDSFMETEIKQQSFRLLDSDSFISLPLGIMIRVLLTSMDVIHSWSMPSLGVKIDAIPGRLNQANIFMLRSGVFFGQCSEICGTGHSFMPISMKVIKIEDFINFFLKK